MYARKDEKLVPRNGHTLVVGIVARISGCTNQKELSLEDQIDHAKQVVAELNDGPVEFVVIQTKGKGEALDRPELAEIESLLRRRQLDLLIAEDLGRLVRGTAAKDLCGIAVDHGTRVIAPNDYIDTRDETWEEDVIAACRDHVGHNSHTSKRLKHKLMNRFLKFGGATARPIAGYDVPPEAKTYDDWRKQDAATEIIRDGLLRLRESKNCEAVAEFFNSVQYNGSSGFRPGPYCRRPKWDGKMVRRFYRNRLLGGAPGRGFRHTVKRHELGRRVSVPNPNGARFQSCPHLAHVDLVELDALNVALSGHNGKLRRKGGFTRKRTRFPGGVGRCAYCGRLHVWGGNGVTGNLMCAGSREWRCWCSMGYDGALATERTMKAIAAALFELQGFDAQFKALVTLAGSKGADAAGRRAKLLRDEAEAAQRKRNVQETMAKVGPLAIVLEGLKAAEAEEARLAAERRGLDQLTQRALDIPSSVDEMRSRFEEQCGRLASDSREFNDLLRKLVPGFDVYLVRLIDGGHPLPRAKLTIRLDGLAPDLTHLTGLAEFLTREVTIDLFDPPQRESIRQQAIALTAKGLDQREIAARLNVTQTAVQKALALDRAMREKGLDTAYVLLTEPPEDYPKLRRHKNRKYRFETIKGPRFPLL